MVVRLFPFRRGYASARVEYPTRKVELERAMRFLLPLVEESLAAKKSAATPAVWFVVLYVAYWVAVVAEVMTFWWPLALVIATAAVYFVLSFLECRNVYLQRRERLVVARRELEQIAADEAAARLVETQVEQE